MTIPVHQQEAISRLQKVPTTRWFCEVKLKASKAFPADHFKLDSWFFPVVFTARSTGREPFRILQRRQGEHGEVPDWIWLNAMFPDRYPKPRSVTGVE